jgi:hypothetical protein
MQPLKCSIVVTAGVVPGALDPSVTRRWDFTEKEFNSPPLYIDLSGAAMNYSFYLMNPQRFNWVKLEWIWY